MSHEREEGQSQSASGIEREGASDQEDDLEAEQESAEAMDAEVPQPPGAGNTTEGQPS